ncbi:transmembrane protein 248 [Cyprinodon tularosa]|uniref:transmembrane protein 248 n=1 Tax=Cyprinodon tularosa TaxID=77115 RepID=UPI0018E24F3D|nr:transmembrane protein 248 [Cyprinodon tularosa]
MRCWQRGSSLKEYASHNPPVATFFLCLLTLAFSFIVISSYSYSHTLPNPDIAKDWNILLSSLSQFHLCEKENMGSPFHISFKPPLQTKEENDLKTSLNITQHPSSVTVLHLRVPLTVIPSSSATLEDISLFTTFTASQLNLGDKELVNLTLEIISEDNKHVCLTISAPTNILPMILLPPRCSSLETNISGIPVEVTNELPAVSKTCYSLHFKKDPALTVMLTLEEQSVAVQHLVEVSVCLVGVCLFLCLAASLKNNVAHREYLQAPDSQNEPLIES